MEQNAQIQIIRADGRVEQFAEKVTLKNLQQAVGGYIEHVRVLDHIDQKKGFVYTSMYVDEDGLLKGKPINRKAIEIYKRNAIEQIKRGIDPAVFGDLAGAQIVGDAVFLKGYSIEEAEAMYEGAE